jgi:hypothetical protein
MSHWYADWKSGKAPEKKPSDKPRVLNASEEIVWIRENVLKKGPKNNAAYADSAKRLSELYKELYGDTVEEDPAT